jgi:putative ABC transport system substrate-binding protein
VPSLNRPGGNITGVHLFFSELSAKKLGLLHDLLPQVTVVAAMLNPTSPSAERQAKDLQNAGRALGLQIQIVNASSAQETDAAFDAFGLQKVGAVIIVRSLVLCSTRANCRSRGSPCHPNRL